MAKPSAVLTARGAFKLLLFLLCANWCLSALNCSVLALFSFRLSYLYSATLAQKKKPLKQRLKGENVATHFQTVAKCIGGLRAAEERL